MTYDIVLLVLVAVLGIIGLLGGVPQLLSWIKPKPHLAIVKATVQRLTGDNYRYQVHLEVENQLKFLRRNGDASNVTAEYYMINKDGFQCGGASDQMVCSFLVAGAKILKDSEAFYSLVPEGNPYSIVFRVICHEKVAAKKKIAYDAAPLIYA
jgi:hypothetical protein